LEQLTILFFCENAAITWKVKKKINVIFKVKIKIVFLLISEALEEALACFYTLAISRTADTPLDDWTVNHGCLCAVKKLQTEVQCKVSLDISVYLRADAMRWPFWCGVAASIANHFSSGPLI